MTVQICVKLVGCDAPLRFVCERQWGADEVRDALAFRMEAALLKPGSGLMLGVCVSRPVLVMSQVQAVWVEVE